MAEFIWNCRGCGVGLQCRTEKIAAMEAECPKCGRKNTIPETRIAAAFDQMAEQLVIDDQETRRKVIQADKERRKNRAEKRKMQKAEREAIRAAEETAEEDIPVAKVVKEDGVPGAELAKEAPADEEERIKCPYCRELIYADARKCKHCGEMLARGRGRRGRRRGGQYDRTEEKPQRRFSIIWTIIYIVVLILLFWAGRERVILDSADALIRARGRSALEGNTAVIRAQLVCEAAFIMYPLTFVVIILGIIFRAMTGSKEKFHPGFAVFTILYFIIGGLLWSFLAFG